MICPNCEMEYVEGINTCSDCGVALVTVDDFKGNLVTPNDWGVIYSTDVMYEAEMYKANLESAGIEVNILGQKDLSFPVPGDLAIIKLLIKKADSEKAQSIIADIQTRSEEEN